MDPLLRVDLAHGSVVAASEALPVMQHGSSQPVLLLRLLLCSEHPSALHLQKRLPKLRLWKARRGLDLQQRGDLQRLRDFDDFVVTKGKTFHMQEQHLRGVTCDV